MAMDLSVVNDVNESGILKGTKLDSNPLHEKDFLSITVHWL